MSEEQLCVIFQLGAYTVNITYYRYITVTVTVTVTRYTVHSTQTGGRGTHLVI